MENKNKIIWIWNHYATSMFSEKGGRHHWFGKYLIKKGYTVKIFCASTMHSTLDTVDTMGNDFITDISDGIEYVFIKTPQYVGNGKSRIKNMIAFYKGLFPVSKEIAAKSGKPDVILASSVHPLTLVAGIKTAKKFKIPCVCEIRDLWPESLIEIGMLKRSSMISKILYKGEAWIYKKADSLIFTMPGGRDYIVEHGLDKSIDLDEVYNINNGIDLEDFNIKQRETLFEDNDLKDDSFKVVYTGSVRSANHVEDLLKAAEICSSKGITDIKFLVYGDGDQKDILEKTASEKGLDNIVFKGRVEKKYIPYILSRGSLNIVTGEDSNLGRYGISWNKLFEYMASGKPILANYKIERYNFIEEYDFGTAKRFENIEEFADAIINMKNLGSDEYERYSRNALKAAADFDYKNLTDVLEGVLKGAMERYK